MNVRTDLALESAGNGALSGITRTERGKAFKITEIVIRDDKSGEPIGRKKGRYITLEGEVFGSLSKDFREMCIEFSRELSPFLPDGNILVAGLGNSDITPDAIGPMTASKILATRHLRGELETQDDFLTGLRPVGVIAGGVLGQTGIETAELIDAVMEKVQPECVIAVDALACSDVNRLGRTIQFSDSGISPGSGVQNKRRELSEATLGVPVIAVGIPTVVDMHTIVSNYTGEEISGELPNMMVTPRDVDRLVERSASMLAAGINMALQPQLDFEEIEGLMW
ncbi:MAG: GPR endopeptidase [Porcipelethomonas sp.]